MGSQCFISNTYKVIQKTVKVQHTERDISKEIALDAQILSPRPCLFFFSSFPLGLQTNAPSICQAQNLTSSACSLSIWLL